PLPATRAILREDDPEHGLGSRQRTKRGDEMEVIQGLLGAVATVIVLFVIIGLVAALFMIIFGIATGIDDQIQS
ncbi:MAG: hypothetical protein M3509_02800, partial [Chloroflexota bacterium]|nr:hypothetical protein [Chloroflexota bacterium]